MPSDVRKKGGFSLKIWRRILSIIAVCLVLLLLFVNARRPCCICDSFRYHAPCLVDLKDGNLIELDIYFPHETLVAELAEQQPEQSTFSFVKMGDAVGHKNTGNERIEIEIPSSKVVKASLCGACKNQLDSILLHDRYILADLYDAENKVIIPITPDLDIDIRCYEIWVVEGEDALKLILQGNLE